MKYLAILVIAFAAACGKEDKPSTITVPMAPGATVEPGKAAVDQAITDTKALIAKKQADLKALTDKVAKDPMNAATYQAEIEKLQKDLADLQTKLEGLMKEAGK